MPCLPQRKRIRQGVTLLESLLALTLFSAGMLAIGQLMQRGSDSALRAELEAYACVHCESAINGIASGTLAAGASVRYGSIVVETTAVDSSWPGLCKVEAKAHFGAQPDQHAFVLSKLVRTQGHAFPTAQPQPIGAGGVQ